MAREGVKDVSGENSQIKARLAQGINDLTKELG
jgi:hypothetical protein